MPYTLVTLYLFLPYPRCPHCRPYTCRRAAGVRSFSLSPAFPHAPVRCFSGHVLHSYRCLGPFLVETCALVEAGVELEQLDKVMKSYGLPVGPITLADEVSSLRVVSVQ